MFIIIHSLKCWETGPLEIILRSVMVKFTFFFNSVEVRNLWVIHEDCLLLFMFYYLCNKQNYLVTQFDWFLCMTSSRTDSYTFVYNTCIFII